MNYYKVYIPIPSQHLYNYALEKGYEVSQRIEDADILLLPELSVAPDNEREREVKRNSKACAEKLHIEIIWR